MKSLESGKTGQRRPMNIGSKILDKLKEFSLEPDEIKLEELSRQVLEKLKSDIWNGEVQTHPSFGEMHSAILVLGSKHYACKCLYTRSRNTIELEVSDLTFNNGAKRIFEQFRGITQGGFVVDKSSLSQIPLRKEVKNKDGTISVKPLSKKELFKFFNELLAAKLQPSKKPDVQS